ncbi:hypothetical protein QVD17_06776 [Tagetes erecta]|uniref:Uncharacterized protein n=1 Tax=Tagetes erecta TaxID=13708 RepID=A0AAD8PCG9_TARER|nr:hypothetical protein QVD17_06776 [Tagetes erecta]
MMHMFKMIYIYILLMFGKDILFPQAYEVLKLLIQLLPVVARNDDVPLAEEKTTFLVKMMAHISTCSQIEYLIKSLLYKHVTCEVIRELDHCLVVRNLFGLTSVKFVPYVLGRRIRYQGLKKSLECAYVLSVPQVYARHVSIIEPRRGGQHWRG